MRVNRDKGWEGRGEPPWGSRGALAPRVQNTWISYRWRRLLVNPSPEAPSSLGRDTGNTRTRVAGYHLPLRLRPAPAGSPRVTAR